MLFAIDLGESEEAVFFQGLHIGLRQRCEFLAAVDALLGGRDALRRIRRKHVIESPCVPDAGYRTVGFIEQFARRCHPNVRMSSCRTYPNGHRRSGHQRARQELGRPDHRRSLSLAEAKLAAASGATAVPGATTPALAVRD